MDRATPTAPFEALVFPAQLSCKDIHQLASGLMRKFLGSGFAVRARKRTKDPLTRATSFFFTRFLARGGAMLRRSDLKMLRHAWVALVFRTLIEDRGGCLPQCHAVVAQVVENDVFGTAILLTYGGTHLQFSVEAFHRPTTEIIEALERYPPTSDALKRLKAESITYVGGQELTWSVHDALEPASLRHLDLGEIFKALADDSALSRSVRE